MSERLASLGVTLLRTALLTGCVLLAPVPAMAQGVLIYDYHTPPGRVSGDRSTVAFVNETLRRVEPETFLELGGSEGVAIFFWGGEGTNEYFRPNGAWDGATAARVYSEQHGKWFARGGAVCVEEDQVPVGAQPVRCRMFYRSSQTTFLYSFGVDPASGRSWDFTGPGTVYLTRYRLPKPERVTAIPPTAAAR